MAEFTIYDSWHNKDMDDPVMRDIYDWEDEFGDFMAECRNISGEFLVIADLGLWDGHRRGWRCCNSLENAIYACIRDMDDFRISESERGKLTIIGYHHDGTNTYELRKVMPGYVAGNVSESHIRKYTRNAHLRKSLGWI